MMDAVVAPTQAPPPWPYETTVHETGGTSLLTLLAYDAPIVSGGFVHADTGSFSHVSRSGHAGADASRGLRSVC
jgi:hypothetical protein